MRGQIFETDYIPRFSGHETFAMRYGWLTKVATLRSKNTAESANTGLDDTMMALGVGKNMVGAIRHWARAAGIVEGDGTELTRLGAYLIGENGGGVDPYFETPDALWLVHWRLAGPIDLLVPHRTATWYWVFNHFSSSHFTKDLLVEELNAVVGEREWGASRDTLKRDVECFLNTYVYDPLGSSGVIEDTIDCPLTELRLIHPYTEGGGYEFDNGDKKSLSDAVFAFCLAEFAAQRSAARSLSVDAITFEPGAPGRVFRLGADAVAERLEQIEQTSCGRFQFVDTAGLRQIQDIKPDIDPYTILDATFKPKGRRRRS